TTARPGSYLLRVHYTPYWQVKDGSLCIEPGHGQMTRLLFVRGGRFSLHAIESPTDLIIFFFDGGSPGCTPRGATTSRPRVHGASGVRRLPRPASPAGRSRRPDGEKRTAGLEPVTLGLGSRCSTN